MSNVKSYFDGAGHLQIDSSHSPLIVVSWGGRVTAALLSSFASWVDRYVDIEPDRQFAFVHDLTRLAAIETRVRPEAASHADKMMERPGLVFSGVVASAAPIRGAVRAIVWLSQKHVQLETFDKLLPALHAASRALERSGAPVPRGLDPATYSLPAPPRLLVKRVGGR